MSANVSPAMSLRSFSNFNDSETVSCKHVTYKKAFIIRETYTEVSTRNN